MDSTDQVASLWDFSDPAASVRRFADAAERADEPLRSVLLTQKARALGLQGLFDQGHQLLDRVSASDTEVSVRRALERGRLLRSAGDAEAAAPQFELAVSLTADQSDDPVLAGLRIDALHMLALLPDDPVDQIRLNKVALDAARASEAKSARDWSASLLNNLGCAYFEAGDLESAHASLIEALRAAEDRGEPDRIEIAREQVAWIEGERAHQR